jgi:UDP-arabinose 4-epimerase
MQLVYSSTCAVYGNARKLPITEATPPAPINPYGRAKLAAEQVRPPSAPTQKNP